VVPDARSLSKIQVRGRSVIALILSPEAPLETWFTALEQHLRGSAHFFADRPVVANLGALAADREPTVALEALDGLAARAIKVIGVEGIDATVLAGTRWQGLPTILHGRDVAREGARPLGAPANPSVAPAQATASPSMLIDQPVRSGQSIFFEEGDVIVIGPVASGAEVIAGGSIHVYGALRGRAIAGVKAGGAMRIFCRKLEAELVAIDGLYRTADHWGPDLHGHPVQIQCDRGALRILALD
jgi:septum site-determining protein MinC